MKALLIIAACIALCSCANDHYVVLPGGGGSQGAMATDLQACKSTVIHRYFAERPDNTAGAVLAGAVGGAVGGALYGAVEASNSTGKEMKLSDLNPATEKCMSDKGYAGTSEN